MSKLTEGKAKYLFFGGKGGVGKTVMASATAIYLASMGKKTLLCSTNPVHSLSSCFGQQFIGRGEAPVEGCSNLFALEIETGATVEKYRENTRSKILDFLKYADIPIDPTPFVDAATTNPAFEESAMFDNVMDVILQDRYDCYIFDTAPVAHTYRLLGMSKMYDMWLGKMIKSREEAMCLKKSLSFKKEKKEVCDPMVEGLLESRRKTEEIRKLLTDPALTAFYFVTLPLALPISVVERFIYWVRAFQIPVGGVIVNQVMPHTDSHSSFVVNKQAEQEHYLELIDKKFGGLVVAKIPMFEDEIRGIEMLKKVLK
ncbi:MAG: ArsA family ATPase [Candidatus Methanoperedens sp.]|nr:ArsA family ATPase [Candidatus Methanoperedens sp.]MCZ7371092.1 ArsA family ATPase [Candidatus Methanoperedens sp.]